jgi:hypothetical protein
MLGLLIRLRASRSVQALVGVLSMPAFIARLLCEP